MNVRRALEQEEKELLNIVGKPEGALVSRVSVEVKDGVPYLSWKDSWAIPIPGLRLVKRLPRGRSGREVYQFNETDKIQLYEDRLQDIYALMVSVGNDFFDEELEYEELHYLSIQLRKEVYRQYIEPVRNLMAFRKTMGNQRPRNNVPGRGRSPVPELLAVPEGPGSIIASMLSGKRGTAKQQLNKLRNRPRPALGGGTRRKSRLNFFRR